MRTSTAGSVTVKAGRSDALLLVTARHTYTATAYFARGVIRDMLCG